MQISPIENFTTMLVLNPQLKIFQTTMLSGKQLNVNFFQNILENLQNLEILKIRTRCNFFMVSIMIFYLLRKSSISILIWLWLKQFQCPNDLLDEIFYNFIDKHPTNRRLPIFRRKRRLRSRK